MLLVTITSPVHASTPGFDTLVNYDTAWTFVYDGGTNKNGLAINDKFNDIKCLTNGVCVGQSGDTSSTVAQIICLKLDGSGKLLMKKLYSHQENQYGYSLAIKKNGDFIIGGNRVGGPLLMQTDSLGNIKWSTWFYDSVAYKLRLQNSATINSLRETSRGTIICAAGDPYPNNNGQVLNNYAAILEFDSLGHILTYLERIVMFRNLKMMSVIISVVFI